MSRLGVDTDPFVEAGFTPMFEDIVVASLKRGRNGQGYGVDVSLSTGQLVPIDKFTGQIAEAVDEGVGEDGVLQVAHIVGNAVLANVIR